MRNCAIFMSGNSRKDLTSSSHPVNLNKEKSLSKILECHLGIWPVIPKLNSVCVCDNFDLVLGGIMAVCTICVQPIMF
jgi:hypothetical protein